LGHASDVVSRRKPRLRLCVDLQKPHVRLEFGGDALDRRRHDLARPTLLSPEVDYDRDSIPLDVPVETLLGNRNGKPSKNGSMAVAAFRFAGGFVGWKTIHRIAVGAD
jgi:hypothetical protein